MSWFAAIFLGVWQMWKRAAAAGVMQSGIQAQEWKACAHGSTAGSTTRHGHMCRALATHNSSRVPMVLQEAGRGPLSRLENMTLNTAKD